MGTTRNTTSQPRTVADIMRRDVITIRPEASLREFAATLSRYHVGAVPVVDDDGRVKGMASATDLLWFSDELPAAVRGSLAAALERHTVSEVMTRDVLGLPPDAGIDDLWTFLRRLGIHRCLVLDDDGALAGIVSLSDLVGFMADVGAGEDEDHESHEGPPA